jgi:ATP-dependent Clp protease adaptor protein ClpS
MNQSVFDIEKPESLPGSDVETKPVQDLDPQYRVICWNDPINLMDFVTRVFQMVFGWTKEKAEQHMMEVHHEGKSLLLRTSREKAEHYVHQLHKYSLHATMEQDKP